MTARGTIKTSSAIVAVLLMLVAANESFSWEQGYRFPLKVRVSDLDGSQQRRGGIQALSDEAGAAAAGAAGDWDVAAGQARREVLCPKRGFSFALGLRPYFTNLSGSTKAVSRGGEGSFLNLTGNLRIPGEKTIWEFYSYLRMWDKVTARVEYLPWSWNGQGHINTDSNFAGLQLKNNDTITTDLNITSIILGADYDVSLGRDLIFGPNADLYIIKWSERVGKEGGEAVDFSQTILQPAIGAHLRYEPMYTGYFSWFKPFMEGRFSWMSFTGLGLSTWDLGAGVAPPVSRNVDAGFKLGYKQWRIEGNRNRLFADVGVEGLYLDFSLQF